MIIGDTNFSVCTSVRDRNDYLVRALPSWLQLPAQEYVIVDWTSGQSVKDAIRNFKDDRITVIRVKNESSFVISRAMNFAISQTKENFILKMDGDIIVKPKRIVRHQVWQNVFYVGGGDLNDLHTFGTIWLTKEMFLKSNGYDERMKGWGAEDNDFYQRLLALSYKFARWSKKAVNHIDHPDSTRLPYNAKANLEIAQNKPWGIDESPYQPEIEYIEKIS